MNAILKRTLCSALLGTLAAVADPGWQVGVAKVKITPEFPVRLDGYAEREGLSQGVTNDLYAKAAAFRYRRGPPRVLLSVEIIGTPKKTIRILEERIRKVTGIPADRVVISATHTHCGPTVWLDDARHRQRKDDTVARYSEWFSERVVAAVKAALDDMAPATLDYGVGNVSFPVNRRQIYRNGFRWLGVNPAGVVDRSVPVLKIASPSGDVRAVLFGSACHGTTLYPAHMQICGDFAGFAQRHVETAFPGATALFLIGFAGSSNPEPRGTLELAMAHGRELGEAVCQALKGESTPVGGPLRTTAERVTVPLQPIPDRDELERMSRRHYGVEPGNARRMLERLDKGKPLPSRYDLPLSVWQFGDDLTMIMASGEMVTEYVPVLHRELGNERLWLAAYCDGVIGYVPTASVIAEGGYETRGLFHDVGTFAPESEQVLVSHIKRLCRRLGRPSP